MAVDIDLAVLVFLGMFVPGITERSNRATVDVAQLNETIVAENRTFGGPGTSKWSWLDVGACCGEPLTSKKKKKAQCRLDCSSGISERDRANKCASEVIGPKMVCKKRRAEESFRSFYKRVERKTQQAFKEIAPVNQCRCYNEHDSKCCQALCGDCGQCRVSGMCMNSANSTCDTFFAGTYCKECYGSGDDDECYRKYDGEKSYCMSGRCQAEDDDAATKLQAELHQARPKKKQAEKKRDVSGEVSNPKTKKGRGVWTKKSFVLAMTVGALAVGGQTTDLRTGSQKLLEVIVAAPTLEESPARFLDTLKSVKDIPVETVKEAMECGGQSPKRFLDIFDHIQHVPVEVVEKSENEGKFSRVNLQNLWKEIAEASLKEGKAGCNWEEKQKKEKASNAWLDNIHYLN